MADVARRSRMSNEIYDLEKENKKLKTELRWTLKQMRNLGVPEDLEKRFTKAEKMSNS
jgi:hypothetical protein